MQADIYQRITDQIVGELEQGVRPWLKPGNTEHAAGRMWSAAMEKGYAAPVWITFKQARELKADVRTGEHGSLASPFSGAQALLLIKRCFDRTSQSR